MKSKKFIAALCALAVVVSSSGGLPFSGLRLFDTAITASAEEAETLLTTITATAKEQASYSVENVATVSFSYTANGYSSYTNNGTTATWGWWGYGWTATVTPAEGYTITKCVFYDDKDRTATDSEAPFVVETTEADKTPQVNGTPILANTSKGITKIEVYGYVTPTATAPVYTITIPESVNIDGGTAQFKAENVTLPDGAKINITVDGENTESGQTTFNAKNEAGDSTVSYTINNGSADVADGGTALTFTGNGTQTLTFAKKADSTPTYAGTHTETLTFGVALEQSEPATVAVSSITIDNAPTEALFVNSTGTLTATVSPDNATDKTVVWSSSDPDYVSINAETGEYTVMGTKGYGSATITATATNGTKDTSDDVTATCTITGKVTYTSLSAGTVLHVGDTFYAGKVYFNTKPAMSFQDSNGVITLVEDNGCYKFKRGSIGTMPNVTAYKIKDNTDGVYIVSGSGTRSDKFTLAVHTK